MKMTLYRVMRVVRVFEAIMKYVMVACWAVCLLTGGMLAIIAAAFGIAVCAVSCLI